MLQSQAVYKVQRTEDEHISITLSAPDLQAEGLHLQTWGSSYLLANRLHRIAVTIPEDSSGHQLHILELGAGTGMVGLSAAAIWGRAVMLTDFETIVPGTAANIALNRPLLERYGGEARCGSLDWKVPETLQVTGQGGEADAIAPANARAHVILTADTLYTDEQPALLTRCIRTWLARDADARVIVCYPLRVGSLDAIREFWELMASAGFETLHEQQERVEGEDWDDEKLHEWAVFRWRKIPTD